MGLKANDLRIGNWVLYKEYPYQVQMVASDYSGSWVEINRGMIPKLNGPIKEGEIEGIPLSFEILQKCGFEKDGSNWRIYRDDADLEFELVDGVFVPNQYYTAQPFMEKAYPKYLHQIQNVIYSLTGEELKVNL